MVYKSGHRCFAIAQRIYGIPTCCPSFSVVGGITTLKFMDAKVNEGAAATLNHYIFKRIMVSIIFKKAWELKQITSDPLSYEDYSSR